MAIGTRGGIQKTLQESNENYFNDLVDSAVLQGTSDNNSPVSASGGQKLSGMITSNYLQL